jgi:two-component system chemotaxis response regulator CheB
MAEQIRVLVVDDSAFMRKVLTDLLQSDPDIHVVGTAHDGLEAVEKTLALSPHVITLDIEMPKMDGYGALRQIMTRQPTPVVMVSSHTREGTLATIRSLALGAVDFLAKPSGSISLNMYAVRDELVQKVREASKATPRYRRTVPERSAIDRPKLLAPYRSKRTASKLVLIGCSTGGPGALHQVIPQLPEDLEAAVLVVQHMPPGFTRSLAARLHDLSAVAVKEAAEGDFVAAGQVLVAPGGRHMTVTKGGCIALNDEPLLHGVRPAVDKTFEAAVPLWGERMIGVILTGMGFDGAKGMVGCKKLGGRTIAEDASTCVVYGMPKVVVELGAADYVLPVHEIADAIVRLVREG